MTAPFLSAKKRAKNFKPQQRSIKNLTSSIVLQGEAEAKELNSGMGITMMFGLIGKDTPHLCHVGDSRYYLADHDQIKKLTQDDTFVDLFSTGQKNSSDPRNQGHVPTLALGFPCPEDLHYNSFSLPDGDKVLPCSEGL